MNVINHTKPYALTRLEQELWDWAVSGLDDALTDVLFCSDNPDVHTYQFQIDDIRYRLGTQYKDMADDLPTRSETLVAHRVANRLIRKWDVRQSMLMS